MTDYGLGMNIATRNFKNSLLAYNINVSDIDVQYRKSCELCHGYPVQDRQANQESHVELLLLELPSTSESMTRKTNNDGRCN
jgi:hypothetical protein